MGDFNGDGRQDLAVGNVNSNSVSILLGNGNGTFGAATTGDRYWGTTHTRWRWGILTEMGGRFGGRQSK